MGQEEYQELSSFLRRFIRRLKLLEGVEGLCLTAICALLLFALGPGIETAETPEMMAKLPPRVSCLAAALKQHSTMFGTGFAILMPRESSNRP